MANQIASLDSIFHALADPTRRAVLSRLGQGSATVSELAAPFDMALPSFVKHLAVLEYSQLISSHKQGRVRTCSLERTNLVVAEHWFEVLRARWADRYDDLDKLLTMLNGGSDDV